MKEGGERERVERKVKRAREGEGVEWTNLFSDVTFYSVLSHVALKRNVTREGKSVRRFRNSTKSR